MAIVVVATLVISATPADAMHISEGALPPAWATLWTLLMIPFVMKGVWELRARAKTDRMFKPFIALVGSALFIISCMPVPVPVVGATSHPCGCGLSAILIGPWLTALVSSVALMLQALFLAHGGVTTLGANTLSMGVMGAFAGLAVFRLALKSGTSTWTAAFMAGVVSDWVTYLFTSFFLASGLADGGSFFSMFLSITVAFIPTQAPLGILEGFITAGAYCFVEQRRPELLPVWAGKGSA